MNFYPELSPTSLQSLDPPLIFMSRCKPVVYNILEGKGEWDCYLQI